MHNSTNYSNSYPPMNNSTSYTYPPDSWSPMTGSHKIVPVEVMPINVNLTVNSNCGFRVYQKEKIFNTPHKQIVIPELNIKVTMDDIKRNNQNFNKPYNKNKKHRHKGGFSNYPNRPYKPPRRDGYSSYKEGSSQTRSPFTPKIIEFDMRGDGGKKSIESFLGKLFGLEKDEEDVKLEAPLNKEIDFDMDKEYDKLPMEIKSLEDLIALSDFYDNKNEHMFGFNMKRLNIIKNSLIKLNEIIGMDEVKSTITNKLITYLQGLGDMDDMNHIVIQAPPGYGKTMLGYHLSEIFYKLGLIKVAVSNNDTEEKKEKHIHPFTGEKIDFPFIVAKRKDMIGEYVGQTAPKVEKMVNKALGGVLFIDEAYSLGSSGRVSYSEECINTLNQLLSEKAGQFICIIAGYKENLKESFFINPGLRRRFRIIFEIEKYTEKELALIFNKMVYDKKWKLDSELTDKGMEKLVKFMKENQDLFKYCGGDMESLLQNVRDSHSGRVFGDHPKTKKIITLTDMKEGLKLYQKSNDRNGIDYDILSSLYI